jgi:chromosome segregation protein
LGKVVTLNGEVFTSDGVIIAGKENRSSVISRPRQKKDLEDRVSQLEQQRMGKQSEVLKLREELNNLARRRKDLDVESRELQAKLQQANQRFSAAERETAQLTQQLDWQNSQIDTLSTQAGKAETETSEAQTDIDKNQQEIAALNQTIQSSIASLRSIPIEELQSQLVHWNTTLAMAERAFMETSTRFSYL